jgi:hypothetical protein
VNNQPEDRKRSAEHLAFALQVFASGLVAHAGGLASKPHAIGLRKCLEIFVLTVSASLAALVARKILLTTGMASVGASVRHLLA